MTVSVVVPYRGDNGGPRDEAWDFVQGWWATEQPGWQLVSGHIMPDEPWVKARAVADGIGDATGDLLVIADADVICDGVDVAVESVRRGPFRWAIPHLRVHRLTETATRAVLAVGRLPETSVGYVRESYRGVVGGGLVVVRRDLYERCPLDPRFTGYGQEDSSWGLCLKTLAGPAWRGGAPLWHLWHPPQPRKTRAIGSDESLALYKRYEAASGSPERMSALLAEIV